MPKQYFYFVFLQEVAAWRALLIKQIKSSPSNGPIFIPDLLRLQKISAIFTSDLQRQIACYYRAYFLQEKISSWIDSLFLCNPIQAIKLTNNATTAASTSIQEHQTPPRTHAQCSSQFVH